jgi:hypothetical protein
MDDINTDTGSDAIDAPKQVVGTIKFTYQATLSKQERVEIQRNGGIEGFEREQQDKMKEYIKRKFIGNGSDLIDCHIFFEPVEVDW